MNTGAAEKSTPFRQTLTLPKVTTKKPAKVTAKMHSHVNSDEVITLLDDKKKMEEEETAKAQRKTQREAKKVLCEQEKTESGKRQEEKEIHTQTLKPCFC